MTVRKDGSVASSDVFDRFWGEAPSPDGLAQARKRPRETVAGMRDRVVADSLTRAQAAEILGCSPQTVSEKIDRGQVIAIKAGREWQDSGCEAHLDTGSYRHAYSDAEGDPVRFRVDLSDPDAHSDADPHRAGDPDPAEHPGSRRHLG